MATSKFIEPTAENIQKLRAALTEMDCYAQDAEQGICALAAGIKALLTSPDSGIVREQVYRLCGLIEERAFDTMNRVNSLAEDWGANFTDEADRQRTRQLHDACRSQPMHS